MSTPNRTPGGHRRASRKRSVLSDPNFRVSRARKGGHARAKGYSPLWQHLMTYFLTERRTNRTLIPKFTDWLVEHGLDRVAGEAKLAKTLRNSR